MEIGTGCPAAGTRCDVRHSLSGSSSGLQLCSWRGWLPHRPLPPLGNRPSTPFLERRAQGLAPACGRACVCTPRWRHSPAWRLATRRSRGDRDRRADQLPLQPPPFPLAATTPKQCCANPPATRLARVAPQARGGAGHVWLFRGCRVQKSILGQKNAKTSTFSTPEITVFRRLVAV